jgi:hypothetical protein
MYAHADCVGKFAWNREEGIPVGSGHQERLENLAEELGLEVPWGY